MTTALLLIDLQNDFMPGGTLAVPDGDATVAVANRLMPDYRLVVATQDWHPADHGSFAASHPVRQPFEIIDLNGLTQTLWPVHCVQGTPGAAFHPHLVTSRIAAVFPKGTDPGIDSYSGFHDNGRRSSTGLAGWLREHGVDAVDIMGLATDYCVALTALDALAEGFATRLIVPGCRGVDLQPGEVDRALRTLSEAGVSLVGNGG
jgi:nicotinamidase/pyrazinamidase